MRKLLVLGASYSLLPLIRAAKRLGLYTCVASIPGAYPGFQEGDESCYADITSPEDILTLAREIRADGVATCCMDIGLPAQGRVCSALGLPGPSEETALLSTNKYLMKQALLREGVKTPACLRIRSEEELREAAGRLQFPLIIKAVDQMGSRGIYRCDTLEEVLRNYPKSMAFTKKDYCILEEFIEGTLFGVEGMVRDGHLVFLRPNETLAYQGFTPTPVGHGMPSAALEKVQDAIEREVRGIIRAMRYETTPFNCDFILRGDQVWCIETTARAGANCLPELIGIYYGVDYYEEIVRLAMGMPLHPSLGEELHPCACLSYVLHAPASGTLTGVNTETAARVPEAEIMLNVQVGDAVRAYTNGKDRLGQVILRGASMELCRERLAQVLREIILEIDGRRVPC